MSLEPKQKNLPGRSYLLARLRAQGLSRRKAVQVVNVILEAMIAALRKGKRVEFPFGSLIRVRRYFLGYDDDDWPANRDGYTIAYELDRASDRELDGLPPRRRRKAGAAASGK